ncbi:MAG TPA: PIF1 family ATP-dependent DNA helicase [Pseudonocardiaceae bacterium]|nr:PIF1 family ATP-dependent DNA helicase [Pseudonocardiaceae bacterium]
MARPRPPLPTPLLSQEQEPLPPADVPPPPDVDVDEPDEEDEEDEEDEDDDDGNDPSDQVDLTAIREPFGPASEPQFLYLAGDAGTGKSYTVQERERRYTDAVLLATTGIAAINLSGTTLNSCLRYFDTISMQQEFELGRLGAALRQLYVAGVRRLCIDEVSMMDGKQLDILKLAVDELNERRVKKAYPHPNDPEQMGITLTGDFGQLPPVGMDKKKIPPEERPIWAFQASCWKAFAANTITLREQHRQTDTDFLVAVNQLRRGDKACVDYFQRFLSPQEDANYNGSTVLATNLEVDRYNKLRMLRLKGEPFFYDSHRTGDPKLWPGEWRNIPEQLELKTGALVMILANGYNTEGGMVYANGDLGYVQDRLQGPFGPLLAVKLLRGKQDIVYVHEVIRERLKPGARRMLKKGEVRNPDDVLATVEYMPVRVAYATTVHKVQGLTLERIQLMINSAFWLMSGMLYVGISRVKGPEGLRIVGSVSQFAARVRANPILKQWL